MAEPNFWDVASGKAFKDGKQDPPEQPLEFNATSTPISGTASAVGSKLLDWKKQALDANPILQQFDKLVDVLKEGKKEAEQNPGFYGRALQKVDKKVKAQLPENRLDSTYMAPSPTTGQMVPARNFALDEYGRVVDTPLDPKRDSAKSPNVMPVYWSRNERGKMQKVNPGRMVVDPSTGDVTEYAGQITEDDAGLREKAIQAHPELLVTQAALKGEPWSFGKLESQPDNPVQAFGQNFLGKPRVDSSGNKVLSFKFDDGAPLRDDEFSSSPGGAVLGVLDAVTGNRVTPAIVSAFSNETYDDAKKALEKYNNPYSFYRPASGVTGLAIEAGKQGQEVMNLSSYLGKKLSNAIGTVSSIETPKDVRDIFDSLLGTQGVGDTVTNPDGTERTWRQIIRDYSISEDLLMPIKALGRTAVYGYENVIAGNKDPAERLRMAGDIAKDFMYRGATRAATQLLTGNAKQLVDEAGFFGGALTAYGTFKEFSRSVGGPERLGALRDKAKVAGERVERLRSDLNKNEASVAKLEADTDYTYKINDIIDAIKKNPDEAFKKSEQWARDAGVNGSVIRNLARTLAKDPAAFDVRVELGRAIRQKNWVDTAIKVASTTGKVLDYASIAASPFAPIVGARLFYDRFLKNATSVKAGLARRFLMNRSELETAQMRSLKRENMSAVTADALDARAQFNGMGKESLQTVQEIVGKERKYTLMAEDLVHIEPPAALLPERVTRKSPTSETARDPIIGTQGASTSSAQWSKLPKEGRKAFIDAAWKVIEPGAYQRTAEYRPPISEPGRPTIEPIGGEISSSPETAIVEGAKQRPEVRPNSPAIPIFYDGDWSGFSKDVDPFISALRGLASKGLIKNRSDVASLANLFFRDSSASYRTELLKNAEFYLNNRPEILQGLLPDPFNGKFKPSEAGPYSGKLATVKDEWSKSERQKALDAISMPGRAGESKFRTPVFLQGKKKAPSWMPRQWGLAENENWKLIGVEPTRKYDVDYVSDIRDLSREGMSQHDLIRQKFERDLGLADEKGNSSDLAFSVLAHSAKGYSAKRSARILTDSNQFGVIPVETVRAIRLKHGVPDIPETPWAKKFSDEESLWHKWSSDFVKRAKESGVPLEMPWEVSDRITGRTGKDPIAPPVREGMYNSWWKSVSTGKWPVDTKKPGTLENFIYRLARTGKLKSRSDIVSAVSELYKTGGPTPQNIRRVLHGWQPETITEPTLYHPNPERPVDGDVGVSGKSFELAGGESKEAREAYDRLMSRIQSEPDKRLRIIDFNEETGKYEIDKDLLEYHEKRTPLPDGMMDSEGNPIKDNIPRIVDMAREAADFMNSDTVRPFHEKMSGLKETMRSIKERALRVQPELFESYQKGKDLESQAAELEAQAKNRRDRIQQFYSRHENMVEAKTARDVLENQAKEFESKAKELRSRARKELDKSAWVGIVEDVNSLMDLWVPEVYEKPGRIARKLAKRFGDENDRAMAREVDDFYSKKEDQLQQEAVSNVAGAKSFHLDENTLRRRGLTYEQRSYFGRNPDPLYSAKRGYASVREALGRFEMYLKYLEQNINTDKVWWPGKEPARQQWEQPDQSGKMVTGLDGKPVFSTDISDIDRGGTVVVSQNATTRPRKEIGPTPLEATNPKEALLRPAWDPSEHLIPDAPKGLMMMPDEAMFPGSKTKKYGPLSGKYIPVDDALEFIAQTQMAQEVSDFLATYTGLFKVSKTAQSPGTMIGNVTSAWFGFAPLMGFNPFNPATWQDIIEAFKDQWKNGMSDHYKAQVEAGLINSGERLSASQRQSALDVGNGIESILKGVPEDGKAIVKALIGIGLSLRDRGKAGAFARAWSGVKELGGIAKKYLFELPGEMYVGNDNMAKSAVTRYLARNRGAKPGTPEYADVCDQVRQGMLDFNDTPGWAEWLGNGTFMGKRVAPWAYLFLNRPFIRYPAKAVPRVLRHAQEHPFRWMGMFNVYNAITERQVAEAGGSMEELRAMKNAVRGWLRGTIMPINIRRDPKTGGLAFDPLSVKSLLVGPELASAADPFGEAWGAEDLRTLFQGGNPVLPMLLAAATLKDWRGGDFIPPQDREDPTVVSNMDVAKGILKTAYQNIAPPFTPHSFGVDWFPPSYREEQVDAARMGRDDRQGRLRTVADVNQAIWRLVPGSQMDPIKAVTNYNRFLLKAGKNIIGDIMKHHIHYLAPQDTGINSITELRRKRDPNSQMAAAATIRDVNKKAYELARDYLDQVTAMRYDPRQVPGNQWAILRRAKAIVDNYENPNVSDAQKLKQWYLLKWALVKSAGDVDDREMVEAQQRVRDEQNELNGVLESYGETPMDWGK